MVTIRFENRETVKQALAFLLGRFSGRVTKSGEHLVPEAALGALADQNISFTVVGKATYEQQVAALRGTIGTLDGQLSHRNRIVGTMRRMQVDSGEVICLMILHLF